MKQVSDFLTLDMFSKKPTPQKRRKHKPKALFETVQGHQTFRPSSKQKRSKK